MLTFVHLSREVDAVHTHTHIYTHTQTSSSKLSHVCPQIEHIWTETHRSKPVPSHLSTLHISAFACCLFLWCPVSSSFHVGFAVGSSSTMGCRSSSRSRCHLLCSRSQNKGRDGGTRGGRGRLGVVQEGQKQGKKEKPKREKTKNIATGCWVTLESVHVETLMAARVLMLMMVGWTDHNFIPDQEKANHPTTLKE